MCVSKAHCRPLKGNASFAACDQIAIGRLYGQELERGGCRGQGLRVRGTTEKLAL